MLRTQYKQEKFPGSRAYCPLEPAALRTSFCSSLQGVIVLVSLIFLQAVLAFCSTFALFTDSLFCAFDFLLGGSLRFLDEALDLACLGKLSLLYWSCFSIMTKLSIRNACFPSTLYETTSTKSLKLLTIVILLVVGLALFALASSPAHSAHPVAFLQPRHILHRSHNLHSQQHYMISSQTLQAKRRAAHFIRAANIIALNVLCVALVTLRSAGLWFLAFFCLSRFAALLRRSMVGLVFTLSALCSLCSWRFLYFPASSPHPHNPRNWDKGGWSERERNCRRNIDFV